MFDHAIELVELSAHACESSQSKRVIRVWRWGFGRVAEFLQSSGFSSIASRGHFAGILAVYDEAFSRWWRFDQIGHWWTLTLTGGLVKCGMAPGWPEARRKAAGVYGWWGRTQRRPAVRLGVVAGD